MVNDARHSQCHYINLPAHTRASHVLSVVILLKKPLRNHPVICWAAPLIPYLHTRYPLDDPIL